MAEAKLKLALVSCRVDVLASRQETRDALDQGLTHWLQALGYQPLMLPNIYTTAQLTDLVCQLQPALVVLSGGNDLGQFTARDQTELTLVALAQQQAWPLLAICRGMQLLAQHAGVSLHPISDHIGKRHQLHGSWQGEVNSYHQYALTEVPADYQLLARSADGCIEAIRHHSRPWLGIMWHPEREQPFCQLDLQRVRAVLQQEIS